MLFGVAGVLPVLLLAMLLAFGWREGQREAALWSVGLALGFWACFLASRVMFCRTVLKLEWLESDPAAAGPGAGRWNHDFWWDWYEGQIWEGIVVGGMMGVWVSFLGFSVMRDVMAGESVWGVVAVLPIVVVLAWGGRRWWREVGRMRERIEELEGRSGLSSSSGG